MSLTQLNSAGFVPESNILTGSATASDTLNITNIAPEQFINSSPRQTKSTCILNANQLGTLWASHPAVTSNFGGRGARFTESIEIAEPVYTATKTADLNVGWNYFAYMLPYPQDLETTLRNYIGRYDAEEYSGGPLAPFFGGDATAASASIPDNVIDVDDGWSDYALRPDAIWEFDIQGTLIRVKITDSSFTVGQELTLLPGTPHEYIAYALPILETGYGNPIEFYFSSNNCLRSLITYRYIISDEQLGIGVNFEYNYISGLAKIIMKQRGSAHNINKINIYIQQIYHTSPSSIDNGMISPDLIFTLTNSGQKASTNLTPSFTFEFGGGKESSIQAGGYIPPYIADNQNEDPPWPNINQVSGQNADPHAEAKAAGTGVNSHVTIMKDHLGAAYIPYWGFNGIGDLVPGFAYQVKLRSRFNLQQWPVGINNIARNIASNVYSERQHHVWRFPLLSTDNKALEHDLTAYIKAMDDVRINLPLAWSFFGYNRIHDAPTDLIDQLRHCTYRSIASHDGGFAKEINHKPTSMSGTINLFNGFNQVLGTDVNFPDHYEEGDTIKYDVEGVKYTNTITAVSLGSMNMQNNHTGATGETEFYYKDQEVTDADITDSVIIVKNNAGGAYVPEWDFDGIGLLAAGEGLQIKTSEAITGFAFSPHSNVNIGGESEFNDISSG
jgi:hypothetical protein